MRRVFAWLIPLALIAFGLLWPLVFRGGSAGRAGRRPRGLQQLPRGVRRRPRRPARRGGNHHRASSPVAATASSATGTSPTRTIPGSGRYPKSPRCCWTAGRCLTACCGRTASGSGWPRSATRTLPRPGAPTCSRSATPSPASSIPEAPAPTGNSPNPSVIPTRTSAFFWNVIAPAWNNEIERADITVTLPGGVTGAQCSVGYRRRAGPARI